MRIKPCCLFFPLMAAIFAACIPSALAESGPLVVRVAVLTDFPPQYSLSESGRPQGFAIEIMEKIANLAGLEIEYSVQKNWAQMFEALEKGRVDLIPNMGITDRRRQWFAFSRPVETFPVSIFVRRHNTDIDGINDLDGKTVAVIRLNIGEVLLKKRKQIKSVEYDHLEDGLFSLLSGNVDALVFPEPVLWSLARKAKIDDKIKIAGEPLVEVLRGVAVGKDNTALLDRINRAVDKLIDSNEYKQIYIKWYGRSEPFWTVKKVAISFSAVLIMAVVFLLILRYHSTMKLHGELKENYEKLSLAEKQLKDAHAQLEIQVEERTVQLTEAINELETVFNASQVGIMVLRGGRYFNKGNQHLADILGYRGTREMEGLSMRALHLTEKQFHEFGEKYFDKLRNREMLHIEYQLRRKDGTPVWCKLSGKALDTRMPSDLDIGVVWIIDDISQKKQAEFEKENLVKKLQNALKEVNQLSGLLPICSHCKKIRDDKGYWNQIESYIQAHSDAQFSHSICEECARKYYPDMEIYKKEE